MIDAPGPTKQRKTVWGKLGWIAALVVGAAHAWETYCYHQRLNNIRVAEQKVVALKTENGFYYSYYEEVVSAPSWSDGIWSAIRDSRSEAPDTINAVERFNIYQELVCGLLFRLLHWLVGDVAPDPWYFFRYCLYAVNGAGRVAMMLLAASCGGGGLRGGLVPGASVALMLFLHHMELSRFHESSILNLREYWACPVIWMQVLSLYRVLVGGARLSGQGESQYSAKASLSCQVAFVVSTVACVLLWQFSAFAFTLQVAAIFLCTLLANDASIRCVTTKVLALILISLAICAFLLFFNELLVHHVLVTECVAIWAVLRWRREPSRWYLFWVDGLIAVALFGVIRLVQSPFVSADSHLGEIFDAKIRQIFPSWPGEAKKPSFNALLYLAVSVFDFIKYSTIESLMPTKVLHAAGVGVFVVLAGFLRRTILYTSLDVQEEATPKPENGSNSSKESTVASDQDRTELNEDHLIGERVQFKFKEKWQEGVVTSTDPLLVRYAVLPDGKGFEYAEVRHKNGEETQADNGEHGDEEERKGTFLEYYLQHTSAAELYPHSFAQSVLVVQLALFSALGCFFDRLKILPGPLLCVMAGVALTPRPLEILFGRFADSKGIIMKIVRVLIFALALGGQLAHLALLVSNLPLLPERIDSMHSELVWGDAHTGELADWMVRYIPANATIMDSMSLAGQIRAITPHRHVIHPQFESRSLRDRVQEIYKFYQCTPAENFVGVMKKFGAEYIVVEYNRCDFSPYPTDDFPEFNCAKGERPWKDLFCVQLHLSRHFKMLFANSGYGVFKMHPNASEVAKPRATSMEDMAVWSPMLKQCQRDEPERCGPRIAELAFMWHSKLKRQDIADMLFKWALKAKPENGQTFYIYGHLHDYELQDSSTAVRYYEKAYELSPNNPMIVKEYLMWLDLVGKDNRTLERLLRTRKTTKGDLLSLVDLRDAALACEASITAMQLMRDQDYADDLWEMAKREGIGNSCLKNNWPMHRGKSMEEDLTKWGLFLNVFLHLGLRSHLSSGQSGEVRWQRDRPHWNLGVSAIFETSP